MRHYQIMDQIMAKPRKAENHMINGKRILKGGGEQFQVAWYPDSPRVRKKLSAVAAPGNIAAGFAPLHDVVTVRGSSFSVRSEYYIRPDAPQGRVGMSFLLDASESMEYTYTAHYDNPDH